MVRKSVSLRNRLFVALAIAMSAGVIHAQNDSEEQPIGESGNCIRDRVFNEIYEVFKRREIEILEPSVMSDDVGKLSCADFHRRQFVRTLSLNILGSNSFHIPSDGYAIVRKNGALKIVEAENGHHYQPLGETKLLQKVTDQDLDCGIRLEKELFVIVGEGKLGFTKTRDGKNIVLKPGYHHLKSGERSFTQLDIGEWLEKRSQEAKQVAEKSEEKQQLKQPYVGAMSHSLKLGDTGCELRKISVTDPDVIVLQATHDGTWEILKAGFMVYEPNSSPVGKYTTFRRFLNGSTGSITMGTSGLDVKAHYKISVLPEKQYNKTNTGDESYASYLQACAKKMEGLSSHLSKLFGEIIKEEAEKHSGKEDVVIGDVVAGIKDLLNKEVVKVNKTENKSTPLEVSIRLVQIDRQQKLKQYGKLREIKYAQEVSELKRQGDKKQNDFENARRLKQDLVNSKIGDRKHKYELEKLDREKEIARARAEKEKAKLEIKKTERDEKKKHK